MQQHEALVITHQEQSVRLRGSAAAYAQIELSNLHLSRLSKSTEKMLSKFMRDRYKDRSSCGGELSVKIKGSKQSNAALRPNAEDIPKINFADAPLKGKDNSRSQALSERAVVNEQLNE